VLAFRVMAKRLAPKKHDDKSIRQEATDGRMIVLVIQNVRVIQNIGQQESRGDRRIKAWTIAAGIGRALGGLHIVWLGLCKFYWLLVEFIHQCV
jgi:hypothetical protein